MKLPRNDQEKANNYSKEEKNSKKELKENEIKDVDIYKPDNFTVTARIYQQLKYLDMNSYYDS